MKIIIVIIIIKIIIIIIIIIIIVEILFLSSLLLLSLLCHHPLLSLFLFVNYYEYERSTFRVDKVLITGENVVLVKNNTNGAWMFLFKQRLSIIIFPLILWDVLNKP